MRYLLIDNIDFVDILGNIYPVKNFRKIPEYDSIIDYNLKENEDLDEIISRPEFYGEGKESLAYALAEINIERLWECNFDLSNNRLKKIKIPRL